MKPFYTTTEAADVCNVSRSSVLRWIHEGKIKTSNTFGGHHRVSREDLLHMLEALHMPIPEELRDGKAKVKILIVDDDAELRQMLKAMVGARYRNYEWYEAENGFEAGYLLNQLCPDVVLLDINLPGLDGFKVFKMLRSLSALDKTSVVVVSADKKEKLNQMIELGADAALQKPVKKEGLYQMLDQLVLKEDLALMNRAG